MIKQLLSKRRKKLSGTRFALTIIQACCLLIATNVKAQIINTVAGSGAFGYSTGGGLATAADLRWPRGVRVAVSGTFYFADEGNHLIRKVVGSNIVDFAGTPTSPGFSGDGGPATLAQLSSPVDAAIDAAGNVYIADRLNYVIRKVDPSGIISTFAGTPGSSGYSGDGGPATSAQISQPHGVAVDAAGNVYIADFTNSVIRIVDPSGTINTYAGIGGSAGYSGDGGPATAAQLDAPAGVRVDASGNVYIAEFGNHTIRKVNTSGIISTFAGTGMTPGFAGDGGPATSALLFRPFDVAVDASGNVFIADMYNNRVRIVDGSGTINTYAGTGAVGFGGDGGPATAAMFSGPAGVAVDLSTGDLYIGDQSNYRIRMVTAATPPPSSSCSDTCYWKVTGNNIIGGNNTFGTLTKDDINIVTNNTPVGIYTYNGLYGLYGWNPPAAPTAYLDVECLNHNPDGSGTSDIRFRNLEKGAGNLMVIDQDSGYVFDSKIKVTSVAISTCGAPMTVPRFLGPNMLGCSQIYDDGTSVGIATTGPFGYIFPGGGTWVTGGALPPAAGTLALDVNGVTRSLAFLATSDEKFKTSIRDIQNPFSIINNLKGKTYLWNDQVRKSAHADGSRQYGFLAQEVAKVFPEAAVQDQDGDYGLYYNAFIPVLVEGEKQLYTLYEEEKANNAELQRQIDELKAKLDMLLNCCSSGGMSTGISGGGNSHQNDGSVLYQNIPNPFNSETVIKFYIAKMNQSAAITITDINGREISRYPVNATGNGSIMVKIANFVPGMYMYSLVVDGTVIDSKKMVASE